MAGWSQAQVTPLIPLNLEKEMDNWITYIERQNIQNCYSKLDFAEYLLFLNKEQYKAVLASCRFSMGSAAQGWQGQIWKGAAQREAQCEAGRMAVLRKTMKCGPARPSAVACWMCLCSVH